MQPSSSPAAPAKEAPQQAAVESPAPKEEEEEEKKEKLGPLDTIKQSLASVLPGHHGKDKLDKAEEKVEKVLGGGSRDVEIGSIGILHPSVLKAYELDFPCSTLEFDIEQFL